MYLQSGSLQILIFLCLKKLKTKKGSKHYIKAHAFFFKFYSIFFQTDDAICLNYCSRFSLEESKAKMKFNSTQST